MVLADNGNLIAGGPTDLRVGSNTILKKFVKSSPIRCGTLNTDKC